MTIDPICRRRLPREPRWTLELRGRAFGFCSDACRDDFKVAIERRRLREAARAGTLLCTGRPPKAQA